MGKFSKYSGDIKFNIAGEELCLKRVKTEKLQKLMDLTKDENNILTNVVTFFTEQITKNYPDENPEEAEAFVQANAEKIFQEFQIAYGLLNRKELEEKKKELKQSNSND